MASAFVGSSPLTRGKPVAVCVEAVPRGLIPTHAGKTTAASTGAPTSRAHPHSRGENRKATQGNVSVRGSSPLTRGKRVGNHGRARRQGLIPTHAGKTDLAAVPHPSVGAHPHSRGENVSVRGGEWVAAGSSPLTRGKHRGGIRAGAPTGLIPTHAGKTTSILAALSRVGAHPHSRGENPREPIGPEDGPGSSPLTRGKQLRVDDRCESGGLIPTHAGKTHIGFPSRSDVGAHPHSRGENPLTDSESARAMGSSPLTRGKLGRLGPHIPLVGLIPTHAGKTPIG